MSEEKNKLENNLMVVEKEKWLTRFFKWVSHVFHRKPKAWTQEPVVSQCPNITIPKTVKMVDEIELDTEPDKNSLEYLYQLPDEELDELNQFYEQQMEESKNEIERLNGILQTYKESIKTLQGKLAEE